MLLRRVLEGAKTLIYLYSHASIIIKAECGQFHGVKLRFKSIRKKITFNSAVNSGAIRMRVQTADTNFTIINK